ncbi:MAG: ABC transporter permease, partial [Terracidiphilus sp.]
MSVLIQDLHFAVRQMARRPGFTVVVVLTMALGIGANAAIFSVLDAVLLKPLPYRQPEGLVKLWTRFTGIGLPNDQNWVSPPEFRDIQQLNRSFSDIAAMASGSVNLGVKGSPERAIGASVSPSLFSILGVQPLIGRTFLPEEAQPGRDREVVLGFGLWQRLFAGNRDVLGRTIDIDGAPMSIVGVMPAGFDYPQDSEIWAPLAFGPADLSENSRGSHGLEVLARIRPGLSLAQVHADLDRVGNTIIDQHRAYPYDKYGFAVLSHSLLDETVSDIRPTLIILMTAVGLVLLIACANIANMLLARSSERQQEMETRLALGASGSRLARQLLTESILLALIGGAAGLAITPSILKGLNTIASHSLPRAIQTSIDGRTLILATLIAAATGILFGIGPAIQAGRSRSFDRLKGNRSTEGRQPKRLRNIFVIGETALSLL